MRKVSSAPSLVDIGKRASLDHHAGPRMGSKSISYSSLTRVGSTQQKEDKKRQGSAPLRVQTQALHSDIHTQAVPPDQVLPEEFAESAKGLAGMDCFELYGGSKTAPALQAGGEGQETEQSDSQPGLDDPNAYALASCLNTPYTGEDKNLGELVESQARGEVQAAVTRLEAQYEKEVSSQMKEQMAGVEDKEQMQTRTSARRRKLMDLLGLLSSEEDEENGLSTDDRSDIAQLLMTSLDDEGPNKIEIPRDWKEAFSHQFPPRRTVSEDLAAKRRRQQPYFRCAEIDSTS